MDILSFILASVLILLSIGMGYALGERTSDRRMADKALEKEKDLGRITHD